MTAPRRVDADFLGLRRHELADTALSAATAAGASYADLRIHRITTEIVQLRDGELETSVINREIGLAVRVIVDGTWGFASHAELNPAVAAATAQRAVRVATTLAPLNAERIELAPEPVYTDVSWVSDYRIDPFGVGSADKIAVLEEYSGRLLAADGVDHVAAGLNAVKEQTFYADTFGSSITQQRVRVMPTLEAVTVDAAAGTFETMRTVAPPTARGWEAVAGDDVWNWSEELAQLPSLLAENAKAYIFIVDYLNRRRIKLWGTARVVEDDPELLAKLMPEGYQARPEQVIVFTVAVWDTNCPQHIPQKIDVADVVQVIAVAHARRKPGYWKARTRA